jgi:hypothetical protein
LRKAVQDATIEQILRDSMFLYLEIIMGFKWFKIIVERDFHQVGVEKDQIILFCEPCDITGGRVPILFLEEPEIIAGRK